MPYSSFTPCRATLSSDVQIVRCERPHAHAGLHQYTYEWRGEAATRVTEPPRWRPAPLSVLAGLVTWIVLAFAWSTLSGCGGGGHKPRVPKPPAASSAPTPSVATTPAPQLGPVECATYTYDATAADFAAIEAAGVRAVVEYVTFPRERLCERLAGTRLKLWFALYHGDGATAATVKQTTYDQLVNFPCPERLAGLYVWDEPAYRGVKDDVVVAALAEARRLRPDLPTFIAYGSSKYDKRAVYPHLTWKGVEWYARGERRPADIAARLDRMTGQPLALIPRAVRAKGEDWTDAELAAQIRALAAEASRRGYPLVFYVATTGGDINRKSTPWLALPETRAAITAVCR